MTNILLDMFSDTNFVTCMGGHGEIWAVESSLSTKRVAKGRPTRESVRILVNEASNSFVAIENDLSFFGSTTSMRTPPTRRRESLIPRFLTAPITPKSRMKMRRLVESWQKSNDSGSPKKPSL